MKSHPHRLKSRDPSNPNDTVVFQFLNPRERREIWILDGPSQFLETVQLSKIRGEAQNLESGWPEPRSWKLVYSVFLNRHRSFLVSSNLWKLGILHAKCPCNVARPSRPARATAWPERASSARRGLGIASEHAHILAAPADARRIESRAGLQARRRTERLPTITPLSCTRLTIQLSERGKEG